MIHIAIDTNGIFGSDRSIKSANFLALKRLVENNELKIHVPYIVKRELETQQKSFFLGFYEDFTKSLNAFKKAPRSQIIYDRFKIFYDEFKELTKNIDQESDNFSQRLLTELNSKFYEIDQIQAHNAFEAYFNGTAPLTIKSPKIREDIPDSFVCRSFEKIKEEVDHLILITNDTKIINTFSSNDQFSIFKNISEFIQSRDIQEVLEELDTIKRGEQIIQNKLISLVDYIEKFEEETSLIKNYINYNAGEEVIGNSIYNIPLSNEQDGEASISGYSDIQNININFSNPIHYGDNQIGFNFNAEIEVTIDYFVDKSAYYSDLYANEGCTLNISVSDWNNYVLHAESVINIKISGIVSIKIDIKDLDFSEISKYTPDKLDSLLEELYITSTVSIESTNDIESI